MMTVRPKQATEEVHRRSLLFVAKTKAYTAEEEELDSGGSSEEMESPRSVGRWRRRSTAAKKTGCVHSQILRIREEDSHLGESTSLMIREKVAAHARVDVVLFARPILPSSPLKNTVNAFH